MAVTDRYTHHVLTFLESINKTSKVTLANLVRAPTTPSFSCPTNLRILPFLLTSRSRHQFDTFSHQIFDSNAGVRSDLFPRALNETLLTDFFGGVAEVELTPLPPSAPVVAAGDRVEAQVVRKRRTRVVEEQEVEQWGRQKAVTVALVLGAVQVGGVWFARTRRGSRA